MEKMILRRLNFYHSLPSNDRVDAKWNYLQNVKRRKSEIWLMEYECKNKVEMSYDSEME